MDYTGGDLYEAEELFRQGHPVPKNRLIFVHYPDGTVFEPVTVKEGQYFGRPVFTDGQLILLTVDFLQEEIHVTACEEGSRRILPVATLPLADAEDCYNLMLHGNPLMLTQSVCGQYFRILWPEKKTFAIGGTEAFSHCCDGKLDFSAWYEDPDYREEVIVRDGESGEILQRLPGAVMAMPDGQKWLLV